MIRAFANYKKDNWDKHIVDFAYAYNSAANSTTLCVPFSVNYGIHASNISVDQMVSNNPSAKSFLM